MSSASASRWTIWTPAPPPVDLFILAGVTEHREPQVVSVMTRPLLSLIALILMLSMPARGADLGEVAFLQALKDIESPFRMMCVAAHPDDEDGATLAYYRMLHGVETHAVIATRGEGGQNEIGPELYNELGVIRTREMQAAAAIEGAQLHFLDLPEFGFSKSAEETLEIWGSDVALERTVRAIRAARPHVIITNHGRMKDHGHHQAIGAILLEAFDVAADPARFPEHQQDGLEAWAVSRLYIRDFQGGEGTVATNISALEPLRGQTIAEIAAEALAVHESQGMAYFIDLLLSERHQTHYLLVKNRHGSRTPGRSTSATVHGLLFDGLALPDSAALAPELPAARDRETLKPVLFTWLGDHAAYRDGTPEERALWSEVNRAAVLASEIRLRATPDDVHVTPGQPLVVKVDLADFGVADAITTDLTLSVRHGLGDIGTHAIDMPLGDLGAATADFSFTVPDGAAITVPHAPRLFEPHFLEPQLEVRALVHSKQGKVELVAPVYLDVAPPLTLDFPDAPYLLCSGHTAPVAIKMLASNNTDGPFSEYLSITPPEGWEVSSGRVPVSFSKEGEQRIVAFTLTPSAAVTSGDFEGRAGIAGGAGTVPVALRAVDVAVPENRRVGVIQSYDTTFVSTLKKLGVEHETLTIQDYGLDRLDSFDTIIVDIRAYQYRPDLVANNTALLDYVARGGTLLVMYQKNFDWNRDFAPYPITLSRNRVTREDAPVQVLVPDHPLFNVPNTIGEEDWSGWIQERGLYFPEAWPEAYTALVQVQDPGEEIPPGSCLIATHGDGAYFYTALGWYRQLRELHPGALRCFANMLAL